MEPATSSGRVDTPPRFAAKLLPSSFGSKAEHDTIDIEVRSDLDGPAEVVFLVRALDEGQRVVRQLSGGLIDAGATATTTIRVSDLALARTPLTISGVLSIYPLLLTESGARSAPLDHPLRFSYHPADGRLLTYDASTRASQFRGGALTDEVFHAAGGRGEEVVAGYRGGDRARPPHDGDGEPDPDHALAKGVSP